MHIENLGSGSIGCLVKTALTGHDGRKWTQPAGLGCCRDQLGLPQLGCWRAPELAHCCRPAELPQQQNPTGQVCASHLPPILTCCCNKKYWKTQKHQLTFGWLDLLWTQDVFKKTYYNRLRAWILLIRHFRIYDIWKANFRQPFVCDFLCHLWLFLDRFGSWSLLSQ